MKYWVMNIADNNRITGILNDVLDILHGNQYAPDNDNNTQPYPDWQQKCHDIEIYCRGKLK